jgi:uncharacterized protein YukE
MIQGWTPPSGPGNAAFPAPPKGDPGGITGASRMLTRAAEDLEHAEGGLHGANAELEADWQGYAANAYHSSSNALAHIARGASETFRECAQAVSGYAGALDDCQAEIGRLRQAWESAKQRQASSQAQTFKLVASIGPTTSSADATRINAQAGTSSGQADDAGNEADGYARRATATLDEFTRKAATYQRTLEGYAPGETPGPFGAPFTAPGTPGRTFGLPSDGFAMPGDPQPLGSYNGVIPVGDPWNSPIPGFGMYMDMHTPEVESVNDLTNLIVYGAGLGAMAGGVDLGASALRSLAEQLGIGGLGKRAVIDAGSDAFKTEMAEAIASGKSRSTLFTEILARARGAQMGAGIETEIAQQEARAGLLDSLTLSLDQANVIPVGVRDAVTELAKNGWAYTSYTAGRLAAVRTALLASDTPAARAASNIIGTILRYKQ